MPLFAVCTNNSNAAKNTTVEFKAAGTYWLTVTITNAYGSSTSNVSVTVRQIAQTGTLSVTPATLHLYAGGTQQFVATGKDQFNDDLAASAFTWSVVGGGTIDKATGLYTAPNGAATATVTAHIGTTSVSTATNAIVVENRLRPRWSLPLRPRKFPPAGQSRFRSSEPTTIRRARRT